MTKRRLLPIAGWLTVVMCLILGASYWILQEPQPSVSYVPQENFDRIKEGMTEAEVEAILKQPGTLDGIRQRPGKTGTRALDDLAGGWSNVGGYRLSE